MPGLTGHPDGLVTPRLSRLYHLIRPNPPATLSVSSGSGGPFSRKTDGTESQKTSNPKFFYPFIYNDLRHFLTKKIPQISHQTRRPLQI